MRAPVWATELEVGRVMHIFHELATFRDTAEYGPSANVSAPPARKATLFFYDFSVTISGKKRNENGKTLTSPLHTNNCET